MEWMGVLLDSRPAMAVRVKTHRGRENKKRNTSGAVTSWFLVQLGIILEVFECTCKHTDLLSILARQYCILRLRQFCGRAQKLWPRNTAIFSIFYLIEFRVQTCVQDSGKAGDCVALAVCGGRRRLDVGLQLWRRRVWPKYVQFCRRSGPVMHAGEKKAESS